MIIVILIFWLTVILALFQLMPTSYCFYLIIAASVILLAHVIEYFVFSDKVKAKGDSSFKSFVMTMLFGLFYFNA